MRRAAVILLLLLAGSGFAGAQTAVPRELYSCWLKAAGGSAYPIPTRDLVVWLRPSLGGTNSYYPGGTNYSQSVYGYSATTDGWTGASSTNRVMIGQSFYRSTPTSATLGFWIKVNTPANSYIYGGQGDAGNEMGFAVFITSGGQVQFFSQRQPAVYYLGGSTANVGLFPTGIWRYVICEWELGAINDYTRYRVFINCVSQQMNSMAYGMPTNWGSTTSRVSVGNIGLLNYGLYGSVDEFTYHDCILTAAEKTNLFIGTKGDKSP